MLTYLVNLQVVLDPFFQQVEGFGVLFGTKIGQLLKWFAIRPEVFRFLPKDFFRAIETPFEEIVCDLFSTIVSLAHSPKQ